MPNFEKKPDFFKRSYYFQAIFSHKLHVKFQGNRWRRPFFAQIILEINVKIPSLCQISGENDFILKRILFQKTLGL